MPECPNILTCCAASPFPDPPVVPVSIGNDEQTVTATCPDGYTGTPQEVTIAANTYFAATKGEANQAAFDAANDQANEALVCELDADCTNLIPTMTANDAPSGESFASAESAGHEAYRAFDGDDFTYWIAPVPGSIGYRFVVPTIINSYTLGPCLGASQNPTSFTFEGSNDGSTWDVLDTQTTISWALLETKSFSFTNVTAYEYYRVNVTGGDGVTMKVAALTMANCGEDNSGDLIQFANGNYAAATAYPSVKQVSGFVGVLAGITVDLTDILHHAPEAMMIVLQAPDGTAVMLVSKAGNGQRFFDPATTITIDDAAGSELPFDSGTGLIAAGSYQVSVDAGRELEQMPGGAPLQPYGTSLADFIGVDPNGAWKLWCCHRHFYTIFDPAFAKIEGGWNLTLT